MIVWLTEKPLTDVKGNEVKSRCFSGITKQAASHRQNTGGKIIKPLLPSPILWGTFLSFKYMRETEHRETEKGGS